MEQSKKSTQGSESAFYYCSCWDRAENPRYRGYVLLSDERLFMCLPVDKNGEPKRFDRRLPPSFGFVILVGALVFLCSLSIGWLLFGVPSSNAPAAVAILVIPMIIYAIWATITIQERNRLLSANPLKEEGKRLRNLWKSRSPIEEALMYLNSKRFDVKDYPIADLADVRFQTCIWRKEWFFWTRMTSQSTGLNWLVAKSLEKMLQRRILVLSAKRR